MGRTHVLGICAALLQTASANAQFGGFGGFGDGGGPGSGDGNDNPFGNNGNGSGGGSSGSSGSSSAGFGYGPNFDPGRMTKILIAHAVMASLVWVVLIPTGGILLRLINSPFTLKLHAVWQVLAYVIYVVAAGMGIWLAQQTSSFGTWDDPHPKLGLAILVVALFMPLLGAVHHSIYKRKSIAFKEGKSDRAPGRTGFGQAHLWIGRLLIPLGIINGGLGIRLASNSRIQSQDATKKAGIIYGIVAAIMFVTYAAVAIYAEIRRQRQKRQQLGAGEPMLMKSRLPTYEESEESLHRSQRS